MRKAQSWFFIIGLFLPILANAAPPECKDYLFLKRGFYMNDYKICQESLKQCPLNGDMPDLACIDAIAKNNRACHQLDKLSKVINGNPSTLSAVSAGRFAIIDQILPADGQHSFYIISPRGCLVETNIDPRELDRSLLRKYRRKDLMTVNWESPKRHINTDGSQSFTALLKITDTCVACEVIGWAKIRFDFDKKGELIQTELESFRSDKT